MMVFSFLQTNLMGQGVPNPNIEGPYEASSGPYFIRVYIKFFETTTDPWATNLGSAGRTVRAQGIMDNLNNAYNRYNIYFVAGGADENGNNFPNACSPAFDDVDFDSPSGEIDNNSLNIYDWGDDGTPQGSAFNAPNDYCQIGGSDADGPASHTELLIHEVGHCLGLAHPFLNVDGGCPETPGSTIDDCGIDDESCCACGDLICDTPVLNSSATINAEPNPNDPNDECYNPNIDPIIMHNYMSYISPGHCRDEFTQEQVKRMHTYLSSPIAAVLQPIQLSAVVYPNDMPQSISGNIIVESGELEITTPIEMLLGTSITVKPGASLKVRSTISGACGQMWRGIIVEGVSSLPQTAQNQGNVTVNYIGEIKDARVGIDVVAIDGNGLPIAGSGGGMVNIAGGKITNNTIGIRFWEYTQDINQSYLLLPRFEVNDDYRGSEDDEIVHLDLNAVIGLKVHTGTFKDLRTNCESQNKLAIGIDSKNAGFRAITNTFENLQIGIRTDKLTVDTDGFEAANNTFNECFRGIQTNSTSNFDIAGNFFHLGKPANCPTTTADHIGTQLRGNTQGFSLRGNNFDTEETEVPDEILIGTDCINLLDGMGNSIDDNEYYDLHTGNRAVGDNGSSGEGLTYFCNKHYINNDFDGHPTPFDYLIVENASIRKLQGIDLGFETFIPTGNVFNDLGFTINNHHNNEVIDYHYYEDDLLQDPLSAGGIDKKPEEDENSNCSTTTPCGIPCADPQTVIGWKNDFYQNRQEWLSKKQNLNTLTIPSEIEEEKAAIRLLRLEMNQDLSKILRQHSLDTLIYEPDSILTWLQLAKIFEADLRLSSHYFFSKDFIAFDLLWAAIPTKYNLDVVDQNLMTHLESVYSTVRPSLAVDESLYYLPATVLNSLETLAPYCDEAGFLAQSILRRNGILVEIDCQTATSRSKKVEAESLSILKPRIRIYPNPAQNILNIECSKDIFFRAIQLFNSQGNLVQQKDFEPSQLKTSIGVNALPSGIYFIRLTSDKKKVYTYKVIISRK